MIEALLERMRIGLAILTLAGVTTICTGNAASAETVRVGGTGMAIGMMTGIGDRLHARAPELDVRVLPSMGTKGGLRALADGTIEVAMAGRRLNAEERANGLTEAACVRTPLSFATSHPKPTSLARADLPSIFSDPAPRWADGTPLKVILRARSGSEMPYLASQVPGLGDAFQAAGGRQGMAMGTTDQQNAELAIRIQGSLAMMTLLQIRSEGLALRAVALDGVEPSAETLADGSYPFSMQICMVLPPAPTPGTVELLREFRSEEGRALIRRLGAEPAE